MPTNFNLQVERNMDPHEVQHISEILVALIACGGLTGVKSGKTIINFDAEGTFQNIELNYVPWKRRRALDTKPG